MGEKPVPLPLAIAITLSFLAAVCASVSWIVALRSSRAVRSLLVQMQTPPSDARLAAVEADQAELFSTLEKLTTTTKRLTSRSAMRERRERGQADGPPPFGAPKAEVRRYYGFTQDGPEFARRQLTLVPQRKE